MPRANNGQMSSARLDVGDPQVQGMLNADAQNLHCTVRVDLLAHPKRP